MQLLCFLCLPWMTSSIVFYFCPSSVFIYTWEMHSLYFWIILREEKFRHIILKIINSFFACSFYCWFSVFLVSSQLILFQAFGECMSHYSVSWKHSVLLSEAHLFQQTSEVDRVGIIISSEFWSTCWRHWGAECSCKNRQKKCYKLVFKPYF